ncbi:MAG: hypothetical protein AB2559_15545 [Candidatus Thiodiazotropha endolucinida]
MEEPNRIGLTSTTMAQLEELLEELNPMDGEEGTKLIKFDLYRLVVALGIKNQIVAPPLNEKSLNSLRVSEFDDDGVFYSALENSELVPEGTAIYEYIERLAEQGIKKLYKTFRTTGQLPFEEYFSN